ncbi:amelotin [Leptodactylus fuscus]
MQTKSWLVSGIQKNILTFILRAFTFPDIGVYIMSHLLNLWRLATGERKLWHVMQLYNTIGRIPQQSQVNPGLMMTPAQVLQNQISQILPIHPYQILSRYLLGNHLLQPGTAPAQISPTYPIFGNLLPLSVPNTQMLPVVIAQIGQQGLLSGSDSEEGIVSRVLMVPVDPGVQGNVIIHQAGVSISGPDSGILMGQPAVNPVGQQGINVTIQTNETVLVESVLPDVTLQEWARDDAPGAGIVKPTPPAGFWRTPSYVNPTVPSDIVRGDMTNNPSPVTENWILCNSYLPDHQEFQGLARGDGHIPVMAPEYVVIDKIYDSHYQIESPTN